uniref:Uncharacterized protein n=1 Tax=Thermosporothrix sp. COM3 TaxID=2490863 RepID=A0A455SFS9_9CHLR|nr:hypothetical protein KTC_09590 [Thermosporothrix sp. COM3]
MIALSARMVVTPISGNTRFRKQAVSALLSEREAIRLLYYRSSRLVQAASFRVIMAVGASPEASLEKRKDGKRPAA